MSDCTIVYIVLKLKTQIVSRDIYHVRSKQKG